MAWPHWLHWRSAPALATARQSPRGLRRHVVLLLLVALLPVGLTSAAMVSDSLVQARRNYRARLVDHSRNVTLALDREIAAVTAALTVLSGAKALDPGADRGHFAIRLAAVAMALGHRLVLHDPPDGLPAALLRRLAARPGIIITDLGGGPSPDMFAPVRRDGALVAVLEAQLPPAELSSWLAGQNRHHLAVVAVTDADGRVIGGTGPDAPPIGLRLPDWVTAARAPAAAATDAVTLGRWPGTVAQVCAATQPDRVASWTVIACEPRASYDAIWQWPLLERGTTALAALALGIALAMLLASRLIRPLAGLTAHARAVVAGSERPKPVPASAVAEFEALRLSLRSAEGALRRRAATERKAMRQARTSRQLLASVLEGAAEGIDVKDLQGRYVVMNRAALASLHRTLDPSLVIGRTVADLHPPEVADRITQVDREVIRTGERRELDVLLWRADGGGQLYALSKAPWRDDEGRIAGVVTVVRDITEMRAAEARLRSLQAELLRATRLSAMGAMASGLAHEVNQPLAASTNFLNAAVRLLDRVQAGDAGALSTARVAMADASSQMLRAGAIVRRLYDFVSRGEVELRPEAVEGLIAEACDLAKADRALAELVLMMRVAPDTGMALMDRTQMQQVLQNLLRNAAEAIRARPPYTRSSQAGRGDMITIAACRSADGGVVITVSDTGPGLPPELANRLFEPFVSTKPTGMGIGLTICRIIVEGHGGRLTGGTGPDGGAEFRITLPPMLKLLLPPALRSRATAEAVS